MSNVQVTIGIRWTIVKDESLSPRFGKLIVESVTLPKGLDFWLTFDGVGTLREGGLWENNCGGICVFFLLFSFLITCGRNSEMYANLKY
jgi:hypothetical protein